MNSKNQKRVSQVSNALGVLAATVAGASVQGNQGQKKRRARSRKISSSASIEAPISRGQRTRNVGPLMQGGPSGGGDARITVTHREYLKDLYGLGTDVCYFTHKINPGLEDSFPWLSSIAANYESYTFRKLQFEFRTSCSTTQPGQIMMAVDYDAADAPPSSKQEMLSTQGAVRAPVWSDCVVSCPVANLQKFASQRYVRRRALANNLDIKTYDVASFTAAVQAALGVTVGELYVSYTVDLITPQTSLEAPTEYSEKIIPDAGTISRINPFGNNPTVSLGGATAVVTALGNTLKFLRAGDYLMDVAFTGGSATNTAPTVTFPTGCAFSQIDTFASGNDGKKVFSLSIPAAPASFTFDMTNCATSLASLVARIAPYSRALL